MHSHASSSPASLVPVTVPVTVLANSIATSGRQAHRPVLRAVAAVVVASMLASAAASTGAWAASTAIQASAITSHSWHVLPVSGVRVQKELLVFAATHPSSSVDVIVQKTAAAHHDRLLEGWVGQNGGRVVKDLSIINAFTARLPAAVIPTLGTHDQVRWVSQDGPMQSSACSQCVNTSVIRNAFVRAINADQVWNVAPDYNQGQGIGVAVVDSGIDGHQDFQDGASTTSRVIDGPALNDGSNKTTGDLFGHGTFIAGIIAGNGKASKKRYVGVAPRANIINVKVSDDTNNGQSKASTVVAGLQWVLENRDQYNIRVVNISLNYDTAQSYTVDPLCAAVEVLWMNGIVVVASAGNQGKEALYPPANDPFVITVGAVDDKGTPSIQDDTLPDFSAYGLTIDGYSKPDLVAPGVNIVGPRISSDSGMVKDHPGNAVNSYYFRVSGTSTAAPMVSAAVALLLESEPSLTPDQVKYRLKLTANRSWPAYDPARAGAGYLDVYAALTTPTALNANIKLPISSLLTASQPTPGLYRAINVNGPTVTIDGQTWEGDSAPNYDAGPSRICNTSVPLAVPTDDARTQMIRCSVRGNRSTKNPYITLSAVPTGTYQVYVNVWQDNQPATFALMINGNPVRTNLNLGYAGAWSRLGPFPVTVSDGQIALTTRGGRPNLSGLEVYSAPPQLVNQAAQIPRGAAQADDGHQGITLLPSPKTVTATEPAPPAVMVYLPVLLSNAPGASITTASVPTAAPTSDVTLVPARIPTVHPGAHTAISASTPIRRMADPVTPTATLSGSLDSPSSSTVDLTAEGVMDWASWGRTDVVNPDRKLAGGNQITGWTSIGKPGNMSVSPSAVASAWTDGAGAPTTQNRNKVNCACAQDAGFQFSVPADTNLRVLKLYVGLRNAGGHLVARLSDGSAPQFDDTSFVSMNWYDEPIRVYTLVYRAASAGQTLTIAWTRGAFAEYGSQISLLSAMLAPGPATQLTTWDNISWNSVNWDSVSWSSVSWSSVSWSSDAWNDSQP